MCQGSISFVINPLHKLKQYTRTYVHMFAVMGCDYNALVCLQLNEALAFKVLASSTKPVVVLRITVLGDTALLPSEQVVREAPLQCLHQFCLDCGIDALQCLL